MSLEHEEVPLDIERVKLDAELETPVFKGPQVLLSERRLGDFERSFTFPTEVDSDHMEASLANGLLRIVVPKKAGVSIEKKVIPVK